MACIFCYGDGRANSLDVEYNLYLVTDGAGDFRVLSAPPAVVRVESGHWLYLECFIQSTRGETVIWQKQSKSLKLLQYCDQYVIVMSPKRYSNVTKTLQ